MTEPPSQSRGMTRRQLLLHTSCIAGPAGCAHEMNDPHVAEPMLSTASRNQTPGELVMSFPSAFAGTHRLQPLPFNPASLPGLSERLITSHHENNYGGAVRNLNRVEQELGRITKDTPPLLVAALRERELTFRNSKSLHEAYFGNLGGNGKMSHTMERALTETYGSLARWEEQLRLTAMGLGGGSGWAVLGFELDAGALRLVSSSHHKEHPAGTVPLLVLDMYEHSYHLDFGAAAAQYIDAVWQNINWEEVTRRLEGAVSARKALLTSLLVR